jgi:very-short-patch-repair endonuclease
VRGFIDDPVHVVRMSRLAMAIDAAWSDRLVSYDSLRSVHQTMAEKGRTGIRVFRHLVEERGPGYVPPASNLEARFASIMRRAGRRAMRRQVDSGDGEGWIGRVDFRDDPLPVIVEIQSERFHKGLTAAQADAQRRARLERARFDVVEITDLDVFHRPAVVLAAVDAARARATARAAA